MDRYFRIVYFFVAIFLLGSCAQLGTIEGGPRDEFPPKPIENGINPPNGSVNFSSKRIEIEFDEYVKLNNPIENISILPTGIKIESKLDRRKLILDLQGEFLPNTTYKITFNDAIKDLNEGNDSLMQYVFSTGNFIDSLSYSGKVADAYSGELQKQMLVALYNETDSIQQVKPLYFSKTSNAGDFQLDYLKAGKYAVFAFDDLNKDLKWQVTEKVGFRKEILVLDSNLYDSMALQVFTAKLPAKITSKSFVYPNQVKIAANTNLENIDWLYQDSLIDNKSIHFFTTDSITFCLNQEIKEDFFITSKGVFDTLFFRVNSKEKQIKYEFIPASKDISEGQKITYLFSTSISLIDTDLFQVQTLDSISVIPRIEYQGNKVEISFAEKLNGSINLKINPNGISFRNKSTNDTIKNTFTIRSEKEFGTIIFNKLNLPENAYIELVKANKMVKQISLSELKKSSAVRYIEPGEYSFRVILDDNQNEKWDGGDVLTKKSAEKVLYFPEKIKVRANWETEVELELK
ncbi:MAG: Ig-like domain-containing protein [Flavobacteriia bacterium]|jgi:hypothetical protein